MLEHAILKRLVRLGEAVETQQKDWHEHDGGNDERVYAPLPPEIPPGVGLVFAQRGVRNELALPRLEGHGRTGLL